MMKGDRAFFYHSNCKVPGIVGTMEIVQEHSLDGKSKSHDSQTISSLKSLTSRRNRL